MIGPAIPAHILKGTKSTEDSEEETGPMPAAGPSSPPKSTTPPAVTIAGPAIPEHLLKRPETIQQNQGDDEDEDDDAFMPALPPDIAGTSKPTPRQIGPTLPSRPPPDDSESDDDYGPMPLPAGLSSNDDNDGVREFIEREKRRQENIEACRGEAKKPKALKRDDWMLAPPTSSDLFSSEESAILSLYQRQKGSCVKLWTETPAERQQRLADEVSGKRKRAEDAAAQGVSATADDEDIAKRRKRDRELREQIEAHNKSSRGKSLVECTLQQQRPNEAPPGIWDHSRDMGLTGRLMDESSRQKMLKDAKGLGDRFGHSRSGGFL
ncbi:hypothetical protein RHS01_00274 [Rhizoctonia solani]|uniref:DUF3752 domain-containing protein n=1 Tax=Rhizoctonia solani TaxID=456999 RepID=A0A8H7ILE0_9AGAM|nr:hypothetical protein RHS01_00274 [Rhizoctonia solani]